MDEPPAEEQRGIRVNEGDGEAATCDGETDRAISRLIARGLVELRIDGHGREAIRLT